MNRLKGRDVTVVPISRAYGIDLLTGHGLSEALTGVDIVIDVSNPDVSNANNTAGDVTQTVITACRNLVGACAAQQVERLVVSTIAGIDNPEFDNVPYFVAKRAAEKLALEGPVAATTVKSTQWYEFATSPAAATFDDHEVVVEDWLIQPIAADVVADVLVEAALGQTRTPRTITGPQVIRLPLLVARLLAMQGDDRRVRAVQPIPNSLALGGLSAPDHAVVLGPDVDAWLQTLAPAGAMSDGADLSNM